MNTTGSNREVHWERTRRLMITTLILWFIFSFGVHWFANTLNNFSFLDFPLGYYMAAQGSLIVFVVLIFWFSWKQHRIDVECGVAEDE